MCSPAPCPPLSGERLGLLLSQLLEHRLGSGLDLLQVLCLHPLRVASTLYTKGRQGTQLPVSSLLFFIDQGHCFSLSARFQGCNQNYPALWAGDPFAQTKAELIDCHCLCKGSPGLESTAAHCLAQPLPVFPKAPSSMACVGRTHHICHGSAQLRTAALQQTPSKMNTPCSDPTSHFNGT